VDLNDPDLLIPIRVSELFWSFGSLSDRPQRRGGQLTAGARGSGYLRRGSGQTSSSDELPAGSGRRRCHDDDQGDTASSKTWSASLIACGIGGGRRLEMRRAMMCFG
jgi:hypothetical protein